MKGPSPAPVYGARKIVCGVTRPPSFGPRKSLRRREIAAGLRDQGVRPVLRKRHVAQQCGPVDLDHLPRPPGAGERRGRRDDGLVRVVPTDLERQSCLRVAERLHPAQGDGGKVVLVPRRAGVHQGREGVRIRMPQAIMGQCLAEVRPPVRVQQFVVIGEGELHGQVVPVAGPVDPHLEGGVPAGAECSHAERGIHPTGRLRSRFGPRLGRPDPQVPSATAIAAAAPANWPRKVRRVWGAPAVCGWGRRLALGLLLM